MTRDRDRTYPWRMDTSVIGPTHETVIVLEYRQLSLKRLYLESFETIKGGRRPWI